MGKSVSIDQFAKEMENELGLYSSFVVEQMKEIIDDNTKELVENTKREAPRGSRKKYYKKIASKTIVDTPNKKINIWYVKDPEYRLTHLLKNGHALRNGGRTKGNDFIDKNYKKMEEKLTTEIEEVIKNGY